MNQNWLKQQELEVEYLHQKRNLQERRLELNGKLNQYRQEAEQLVSHVLYLTREDNWDRRQLYSFAEMAEDRVRQAGKLYERQLDVAEEELTHTYHCELRKLDM